MTPKEKAKELYLKYSSYVNEECPHTNTIKCAIITIDEIMNTLPESAHITMRKDQDPYKIFDYWEAVKKEIELL